VAGSDVTDEDFDVVSMDVDGAEAGSVSSKNSGVSGVPKKAAGASSPIKAGARAAGGGSRSYIHCGNKQSGARQRSNIFLSNVPRNCSEEHVRAAFGRFGNIAMVSIARDGRGVSKGHGNLVFVEADAAHAAVAQCDQGRLALSDGAGKKCPLSACWAETLTQAQQGFGQTQQGGDKGARRRRKKEIQSDVFSCVSPRPEELQWHGVMWEEFPYQPFVLGDYQQRK